MPYHVDANGMVIPGANPVILPPTTTPPATGAETVPEAPEVLGWDERKGLQYRLANGQIEYVEPARPEGLASWTPEQRNAWVLGHLRDVPPAGVPLTAGWDPAVGDWWLPSFSYGNDNDRSDFRQYFDRGVNPMANYVGGSYVGPGSPLLAYGGRRDVYPNPAGGPEFSVPTTSIRGSLRYGDTGYRGPAPAPAPVTLGLAPERPLGVPENWVWDTATNAWRPPGMVSTVVGVNTVGRNTGLGSTTETAAPRYTATPPNEVPPPDLYNHNQDGTVSPPGTPGPVAMWNYNSDLPTRPSPDDIRLANLGYIDNRIQYAGMA